MHKNVSADLLYKLDSPTSSRTPCIERARNVGDCGERPRDTLTFCERRDTQRGSESSRESRSRSLPVPIGTANANSQTKGKMLFYWKLIHK